MESYLFRKYTLIIFVILTGTLILFGESTPPDENDSILKKKKPAGVLSVNIALDRDKTGPPASPSADKTDSLQPQQLPDNSEDENNPGSTLSEKDNSIKKSAEKAGGTLEAQEKELKKSENETKKELAVSDKSKLSLETNSYIEYQIKYLTETKRDFLLRSSARCQVYIKEMKEVFKKHNLPEELAYLPLIESGFNSQAVSYMGAAGMWQFMPGTAKWLGMKMNAWVDDRYDPITACEYAAQFLNFLYDKLGSWELALAAYNHGGFNVKKAINRAGSRDYYDLVKKRTLPRETRDYVPRFIASILILQNPEKYKLSYKELDNGYTYISLPFMSPAYLVAHYADMTTKEFMKLNTGLRSGYVPHPSYNYKVRLPKANHDILVSNLEILKEKSYDNYTIYYIKSGDNLSSIAQRFGISIYIIMSLNRISNANKIWEGQKLYIPVLHPDGNVKTGSTQKTTSYHVVKAGETLSHIAYKFGVSVDTIIKLNNIANPGLIRAGEKLRIH